MTWQTNIQQVNRMKVFAQVRKDPSVGVTELAERLRLSRMTVRRHLTSLTAQGLIEYKPVRRRRSKGKNNQEPGRAAFVPRKKKTDALQKRIDMVVERALASKAEDPGHDVIQHNPHRLRVSHATKIG